MRFAGVSAPCPFCAQVVTAPHPKPAPWAPAPAAPRTAIKRLTLPDHLSDPDPPLEAVRDVPRDIRPLPDLAKIEASTTDSLDSKLDQLFDTMLAMEERTEARPRLRRKGKVPFARPLRRTDDVSLRMIRSR